MCPFSSLFYLKTWIEGTPAMIWGHWYNQRITLVAGRNSAVFLLRCQWLPGHDREEVNDSQGGGEEHIYKRLTLHKKKKTDIQKFTSNCVFENVSMSKPHSSCTFSWGSLYLMAWGPSSTFNKSKKQAASRLTAHPKCLRMEHQCESWRASETCPPRPDEVEVDIPSHLHWQPRTSYVNKVPHLHVLELQAQRSHLAERHGLKVGRKKWLWLQGNLRPKSWVQNECAWGNIERWLLVGKVRIWSWKNPTITIKAESTKLKPEKQKVKIIETKSYEYKVPVSSISLNASTRALPNIPGRSISRSGQGSKDWPCGDTIRIA